MMTTRTKYDTTISYRVSVEYLLTIHRYNKPESTCGDSESGVQSCVYLLLKGELGRKQEATPPAARCSRRDRTTTKAVANAVTSGRGALHYFTKILLIMELKGKVALITGAAAGIGLAYSEELLKQGAKVTLISEINMTSSAHGALTL